jgi:inhibitor of KinA sporulation pathway (predicted exonuclease)
MYVQPTLHPFLTGFCIGLTGISQATVDNAKKFPGKFHLFIIRSRGISEISSMVNKGMNIF